MPVPAGSPARAGGDIVTTAWLSRAELPLRRRRPVLVFVDGGGRRSELRTGRDVGLSFVLLDGSHGQSEARPALVERGALSDDDWMIRPLQAGEKAHSVRLFAFRARGNEDENAAGLATFTDVQDTQGFGASDEALRPI